MTASAFDHPILSGLLGDEEISALLSASPDLEAMGRFELALARAQATTGLIPMDAAEAISAALAAHVPDIAALRSATARDGVVVPQWVKQVRAALPEPVRPHFHFGATSQDVIDTSLILRLKTIAAILDGRLEALIAGLATLEDRFGHNRLMARTRMQDALEIEVRSRLADWRLPLERHRDRLAEIGPRLFVLQMGGAAGDRAQLGDKADEIVRLMAVELALAPSSKAWHSQRDGLFEFAGWLAQVSGSLGKIGQDAALMALAGPEHIVLSGGGGSSAMPHKSNPVAAEVLVSLARYNATLLGGMGQGLVHEQERSGAAWTLEWLVLPQMLMTAGSGLLLARKLLDAIQSLGQKSL